MSPRLQKLHYFYFTLVVCMSPVSQYFILKQTVINKIKQDNEESINISDNVNLKSFYPPASEARNGGSKFN